MKGEGKGAGEKDSLGRVGDGRDRERRRRAGNIDRRRRQVMQDLADLAAVFMDVQLRGGGGVFDDRRGKLPGEPQIVMVPTKEEGLEQDGKKA
jgi:hypothetical protein